MHVLLVEDEKPLAEALKEILSINKYLVDVAYDGQCALDYIEDSNYDIIILDIMLPKVDGINVLKIMRSHHNLTPVILLTAKSQIDDKVLGLDSGANDYLTKPFNTKELLARIRVLTRLDHQDNNNDIVYGNIKLNRLRFELSSDNDKFTLTNKEYLLMETLLNNIGIYLSSEQLLDKVWGYESESEINVVWVALSSLRKKLEKLQANIYIKSNRNLGYTLEIHHD
ncbi:MAG: response regulator transcription factor [Erysipelotrichaceae bacterium]